MHQRFAAALRGIDQLRWATLTHRVTIPPPSTAASLPHVSPAHYCRKVCMNTVTLLAEALQLARECQYQIREEDLEGAGGGHCSFSGKKWLLLDVTQSAHQQLEDTLDALRCEP